MTYGTARVEAYRSLAHGLHGTQSDKAGEPYWKHLDAVEMGVVVLGGSEAARVAALFHDSVEDGWATFDDLLAFGLTEYEVDLVDALTKRNGESRRDNLRRIVRCGREACMAKVADLLHNTRHDRVARLREIEGDAKVEARLTGYRRSLRVLLLELDLIEGPDRPKIFVEVLPRILRVRYTSHRGADGALILPPEEKK